MRVMKNYGGVCGGKVKRSASHPPKPFVEVLMLTVAMLPQILGFLEHC